MPNPILARADALMSKRRQTQDVDDLPVLTDVIAGDDDIPVLDAGIPPDQPAVATISPAPATMPLISEPTASLPDTHSNEELVVELTRRISQRLAAELPRLIETTVRDYLAEREMIADQLQRP